jgi:hypothetical protein
MGRYLKKKNNLQPILMNSLLLSSFIVIFLINVLKSYRLFKILMGENVWKTNVWKIKLYIKYCQYIMMSIKLFDRIDH